MYLALARKYRPQRFLDLIGQPHVTKTLQNAFLQKKLYPALIFSGVKGVGKTSAARILSKILNCKDLQDGEPCNQCENCLEITADRSPDYIEIDGASNNGVEEVRNLREKVRYRPLKNPFRVVVIDEVHMLSNSAWNALLKTIEEPPEHTYFILATTDFHKIPATIVSRCQHFEFKTIALDVIKQVLRDICNKENVQITDYALFMVAKSAEGSLRDAKKVLDQAIALAQGEVKDQDVADILGVVEEDVFIALMDAVLKSDRSGVIGAIQSLCEGGMDLRVFYTEFLKFLRDLIIFKSIPESGGLHNLNPSNLKRLHEVLSSVDEVELLRYFHAAKDLEQTMRNTENPRIMLEYLFIKLSYFPRLVPIEEAISRMGQSKSGDSSAGQPRVMAVAPRPAAAAIPDPNRLGDDLQAHFMAGKSRLAAALSAAELRLDGQALTVVLKRPALAGQRIIEENVTEIETKVSSLIGRAVKVLLQADQASALPVEADVVDRIKKDERITSLADKIKGQIISIEQIKGD
jgi:DNA polymerase-3 subunit gamma/tau